MIREKVGPYAVLARIGEGGMGEVYRARDLNLNRDVALKALPAAVAHDQDRLARFRREAQVLASLNHPNVGHIYGFEDGGGSPVLVLELIEGPTLADRLQRGALSLEEALRIARQIALALEAAHAQGIIHRDLKPSNIKIKDNGTVKVLDFGLAKALSGDPASDAAASADSPTLTNRATALGIILGTAAYMAPEQARGKVVDKRADIWSFGVVLFEMLTGRRLFQGDDVSDTLAEVLKVEIDWRGLPPSTPASLVRLLRRCLERDLKRRLHDIADARVELDDLISDGAPGLQTRPSDEPGLKARPPFIRERVLWGTAIIAIAVASALIAWSMKPTVSQAPETRLQIVTPPSRNLLSVAVSPDGRTIAYYATVDGKTQIWLRPLDAAAAHPVQGSEGSGGLTLDFAADGNSLIYGDVAAIKTIPVTGGSPRQLSSGQTFGISFNREGSMLVAPTNVSPILRIPPGGSGPGDPVTRVTPPMVGHRAQAFLPDGRHFLFLATGPANVQGVYLASVDSPDMHLVGLADEAAVFMEPDVVIFGRQDSLFAQRVNIQTGALIDAPVFVAAGEYQNRAIFGAFSLSAGGGTIAYREAFIPRHQLRWLDRSGREIGPVGDVDEAENEGALRLSPDGRMVLISRRVNGNTDLWTIENTEHGTFERVTTDPAIELSGVWSPDSTRIGFSSSRRAGGFYSMYEATVGRSGADRPLLEDAESTVVTDWSRDGKYLLYQRQGGAGVARDLWALPMDGSGDGKPFPITSTPADEVLARFSADAKWVAYQSNSAGPQTEVFIRPVSAEGREWRISTAGGTAPRWKADGRELYYLDPDLNVMMVPLTLPSSPTGNVEHGAPVKLFAITPGSSFDAAPDGQRFIVNLVLDEQRTPPISVILNWRAGKR